MPQANTLVTVTVNGTKVRIPSGTTTFAELAGLLGKPAAKMITLVSSATPPSTIGGNDSYRVAGGETFTL